MPFSLRTRDYPARSGRVNFSDRIYWFIHRKSEHLSYRMIPKWLIYPQAYLIYIPIRGHFSGFYPYPFVDVSALGMTKVLFNSAVLMGVFSGVSACLIWIQGISIKS